MYTVYKITNLINNKCYIGSSIRVEKRWRQHINSSKNINDKKYNYPLYQDFRKFGLENFTFEIIFDDFNSIYEMEDYEQKMIDKYNSLTPNGYNQTRMTHSNNILSENCQNILAVYVSYHDAARQNGYDGDDRATSIRRVCKGELSSFNGDIYRDLDEYGQVISKQIKNHKGKKHIIGFKLDEPEKEIYFESISEAAKQLNTDRGSLSKCIQGVKRYSNIKGYVFREIDIYGNIIDTSELMIDDVIKEYEKRHPIIEGVRHSIPEWCKIYNIKQATVNARIRNGMSSIDAITTPIRR